MNQKGVFNVVIITIVILVIVIGGYFTLIKKGTITRQETPAPVTDEKEVGYIKTVYEKAGNRYLDIDYISMLRGIDAVKAKIEDGECLRDKIDTTESLLKELEKYGGLDIHSNDFAVTKFGPCVPPSGYYVRNQDPQIKTLEISKDVQINRTPAFKETSIDYEELQRIFDSKDLYHIYNIYSIKVVDELIVNITELFTS